MEGLISVKNRSSICMISGGETVINLSHVNLCLIFHMSWAS